MKFITTLRINF